MATFPLDLLPFASLEASNLPILVYFLAAEALAVAGTWSVVALNAYTRSRLLELARAEGDHTRVEACLQRTGAYELSAHLLRILGTVLLAVGFTAVVMGTRGEGEIAWGGIAAAAGLTFGVVVVVNEVVVRLLARRHPNRFLLWALPGLEVLRYATIPLRMPLVLIARFLFRTELEEPEPTAREEVLESVEEGEREGSLTADEAEMIESIIDMDRATAEQICTPRGEIAMVHQGVRLEQAARFIIEEGHRRVPVYGKDRDDVVGVIYAFDLLAQLTRENRHQTVRQVMRSPFFVPEGKPLNDLLDEMRRRRVSLAVVLNEFGGTSGVVTIEDVLEVIVGEIEDEHDRDAPAVVVRNGVLVVDGRTSIEDVNEALSVSLPTPEDFETVGGLVFHHLGKVPQAGDVMILDGVTLTVMEADERTAKRLQVEANRQADVG